MEYKAPALKKETAAGSEGLQSTYLLRPLGDGKTEGHWKVARTVSLKDNEHLATNCKPLPPYGTALIILLLRTLSPHENLQSTHSRTQNTLQSAVLCSTLFCFPHIRPKRNALADTLFLQNDEMSLQAFLSKE